MIKNCEKVEEAKKRPRRSDLDTLQPNSRDEPYISSSQHENWFLGQRALLISPEAILSRHNRAKSAASRSWHGRDNGSGIDDSLPLLAQVEEDDHYEGFYKDRTAAIKFLFLYIFGALDMLSWHDMNVVPSIMHILGIPKNSYSIKSKEFNS